MCPLSPGLCCWPVFTDLLWLPVPRFPVPHSPRPLSPDSPCRLEKELETLENSSSVTSTKENLAEAAAKEEKAEAVPNAQKVGTGRAASSGVGWVCGFVAVQAVGLWRVLTAPLTSPFCFAESPGHS